MSRKSKHFCGCGCGEAVVGAKYVYALGHNPNSHKNWIGHGSPSKETCVKLSRIGKKNYKKLSCKKRQEYVKPLQEGNSRAWKDPDKKKSRVSNIRLGVRRYCQTHQSEVSTRNKSPQRRARISRANKRRWRTGHRVYHPVHDKVAQSKSLSKGTRKAYRDGRRKPATGSDKQHCSGWYRSSKSTWRMHYRSSWELSVYKHLDAHPQVLSWDVEVLRIFYIFRGKSRTYFVDLFVRLTDGRALVVEVKPAQARWEPNTRAKLKAAERFCTRLCLKFVVLSQLKTLGADFDAAVGPMHGKVAPYQPDAKYHKGPVTIKLDGGVLEERDGRFVHVA